MKNYFCSYISLDHLLLEFLAKHMIFDCMFFVHVCIQYTVISFVHNPFPSLKKMSGYWEVVK